MPTSATHSPRSAVLWIDGVGVFQLILTEEVVVGRVGELSGDDEADIALMGNLSRKHVTFRRSGEDYIVTPCSQTVLNGRLISEPTVLSSPSELQLNDSVLLRFELCSPLSMSARLEVLSNHRGRQPINGFVLMAETCLLGPGQENHIRCPSWPNRLVMVQRDGGLAIKSSQMHAIDDQPFRGWTKLEREPTMTADGLRMWMEISPLASKPISLV